MNAGPRYERVALPAMIALDRLPPVPADALPERFDADPTIPVSRLAGALAAIAALCLVVSAGMSSAAAARHVLGSPSCESAGAVAVSPGAWHLAWVLLVCVGGGLTASYFRHRSARALAFWAAATWLLVGAGSEAATHVLCGTTPRTSALLIPSLVFATCAWALALGSEQAAAPLADLLPSARLRASLLVCATTGAASVAVELHGLALVGASCVRAPDDGASGNRLLHVAGLVLLALTALVATVACALVETGERRSATYAAGALLPIVGARIGLVLVVDGLALGLVLPPCGATSAPGAVTLAAVALHIAFLPAALHVVARLLVHIVFAPAPPST